MLPEAETPNTVTPLVRFFYDVQLLEIGYTPETEEFLLNWIVPFLPRRLTLKLSRKSLEKGSH